MYLLLYCNILNQFKTAAFLMLDSRLFILVALNNSKSAEELDKEKDTLGIGDLVVVKVPKRRPLTRAQFEVGKQYWPLYFHEDKRFVQMKDCVA